MSKTCCGMIYASGEQVCQICGQPLANLPEMELAGANQMAQPAMDSAFAQPIQPGVDSAFAQPIQPGVDSAFVQPTQQSVITQSTTIVTEGKEFSNSSTTVVDASADINTPFNGDNGMTGSTLMEVDYGSTAVLTADMAPGVNLPNVPQYIPQEPINIGQPVGYNPNLGMPMDPNMNMGQPMGFDPSFGMPMDPNMNMGQTMGFDPNMGMPINTGMEMPQAPVKQKKASSGKGVKIAGIILLVLAIAALIADGIIFGLSFSKNKSSKYKGAAKDGIVSETYEKDITSNTVESDSDGLISEVEPDEEILEEED